MKCKDLLEEAGKLCSSKFIIFLDGIDQMDAVNEPFSLEWMPKPVPEVALFKLKTYIYLNICQNRCTCIQMLPSTDFSYIVFYTFIQHLLKHGYYLYIYLTCLHFLKRFVVVGLAFSIY